jgi:hypothetical protein
MSKNLISFLERIHVPAELIKRLATEPTEGSAEPDINLDNEAKAFLDSRNTYYESTLLKEKLDKERTSTVSKYNITVMKKVNDLLGMGLTNSEMEAFKEDLDGFMSKSKEFKAGYEEKLKSTTDETLRKDLDGYKLRATEAQKTIEEMTTQMAKVKADAEKDRDNAIREYKAKETWNKLVIEDKEIADVPGKAFILGAIEERIFGRYIVNGDGTLLNKDGSVATHPEKEIAVTHIKEVYPYYKDQAGLRKVSNAGDGNAPVFVDGQNGGKVVTGDLSPAVIAKLKEFDEIRGKN